MSVLPADSLSPEVQRRILAPLARLRARCRLYLLQEGLTRLVLAFIVAGLAQLLLDRWLRLSLDQRALMNVFITVIWLVVLYRRVFLPLSRPLDDRLLAERVDRANPRLADRMATAVQFARGQVGEPLSNSPALVAAALEDACQAANQVEFLAVLDHRRARHTSWELGGLVLLVAAAFLVFPELMRIWFQRNWLVRDIPWPQRTYILPIDFDDDGVRRFPRGDELEISALVKGEMPNAAELTWWTASGRGGEEAMTQVGRSRLVVSLGPLTDDVSFQIEGGDEQTREFLIEAIDRPRLIRTVARITAPAYAGLEPIQLEQQTVLEVLAGSTVQIDAWLNKPVRKAEFVGGETAVGQVEMLAPDALRLSWDAPVSGSFLFKVEDRDGWEDRHPVRFTIKVVPDRPPSATLELPGVGEIITPRAVLPVRLELKDAYGLGSATLHVQRDADPPRDSTPQGFEPRQREYASSFTLPVEPVGVQPGSRLRLWVEAADTDPSGPNAASSDTAELRVVSPEDFLAEMARRELELRRDFEQLLSAQRGLRDALERAARSIEESGPSESQMQQLIGLARRQDAHAARCITLAQRFEQILREMQANRVNRPVDERRIYDRVVLPLAALGRETMPGASAGIAALRSDAAAEPRAARIAEQNAIVLEMQTILSNMLEWEGFREAVDLLREIIAEQARVRDATLQAVESEVDDILGSDEPAGSQPADGGQP